MCIQNTIVNVMGVFNVESNQEWVKFPLNKIITVSYNSLVSYFCLNMNICSFLKTDFKFKKCLSAD